MPKAGKVFIGFEGFTAENFIRSFGWKDLECVNNLLWTKDISEVYKKSNKASLSRAMKGNMPFSKDAQEVWKRNPKDTIKYLRGLDLDPLKVLKMANRFCESVEKAASDHWALPFASQVTEACEYLKNYYDSETEQEKKKECIAQIVYYLMLFFFSNGKRPEGTPADQNLTTFVEEGNAKKVDVTGQPQIMSTIPCNPEYYQPRTEKREEIKEQLDKYKRVVITAMGGVGKTAIVQDYVVCYGKDYKKCVYTDCSSQRCPTLAEAIANDHRISITGLQRGSKSLLTYAKEKLAILGQWGYELLLVIDNYDRRLEDDDLYQELQNTGCSQLITSRWVQDENRMYASHHLPPITDPEMLRKICEGILLQKGQEVEWDEDLAALVRYVQGNIKALEVLLGQMCASYLKPHDLRVRLEEAGIHRLELTESVDNNGNNAVQMLSMLFDISAFNDEMKRILFDLSMVPLTGILVHEYIKMAGLPNADRINSLINRSWIERQGGYVHLHPIVTEAVLSQVKDKKRSVLIDSPFFNHIGEMADHNWAISAKDRALIAPIVRNVLDEKPEIDETTVPLLENLCRLAFDDTSDVCSIAMDTLIRIEAYWRGRDTDKHLYVSYLIVEYVPGVLIGTEEMERCGYTPPTTFDVQVFIKRWNAHIDRLTKKGRYAMAAQCRMIGVRHIRAERGNQHGADKLKEELNAIQKLKEAWMKEEADLSYLRNFSGLYGYRSEFLAAAVQHFSSRILFMLADNGHLGQEAYQEAYGLVQEAQRILLSPDQYSDFDNMMYHRVKADVLCTEGHILLKMGKYGDAANILYEGIEELNRFLVPLSRRYLVPYMDMVCAAEGLETLGKLDADQKRLLAIYKEKIREIESGL